MAVESIELADRFDIDIFQKHTHYFLAVDIDNYAALESNQCVQRGKTADITVMGRIKTSRCFYYRGRIVGHAETSSGYDVNNIDDGRVSEVDTDSIVCDDALIILLMSHELEEETNIVLIPFQHFFGFGTRAVRGKADDASLNREIPAIVFGFVWDYHRDSAKSVARLRTQSPQKRDVTS